MSGNVKHWKHPSRELLLFYPGRCVGIGKYAGVLKCDCGFNVLVYESWRKHAKEEVYNCLRCGGEMTYIELEDAEAKGGDKMDEEQLAKLSGLDRFIFLLNQPEFEELSKKVEYVIAFENGMVRIKKLFVQVNG